MAFRRVPIGAFKAVIAHPEWSVRECQRRLGVSVGVVTRWRKMIALGQQPRPPGRPKGTDYSRLKSAFANAGTAAGLVRILKRIKRTQRRITPEMARDLKIMLYQTSYEAKTGNTGMPEPVMLDVTRVAADALGDLGEAFLAKLLEVAAKPDVPTRGHGGVNGDDDHGQDQGEGAAGGAWANATRRAVWRQR